MTDLPIREPSKPQYHAKDATSRAVHFPLPHSLTSEALAANQPGKRCDAGESVRREFDTKQAQSRAFCIDGLLSPSECDALIEATEKIGYDNVDDIHLEYPKDYRNNQRMIYINTELANTLWIRLQHHIKPSDITNVTPIGYCSTGCWVPVGLNEGFIFSKYSAGQYFKPHRDGLYVNADEDCSIFSVVIYLNELAGSREGQRPCGGNLNFLDASNKVLSSFVPRKGTAIIFNSDAFHEGELLREGYKYMVRTFVMFQNVNRFFDARDSGVMTNDDAQWKEVVRLFHTIEESQRDKDVVHFTDMYLKAQKMQLERAGNIQKTNARIAVIPADLLNAKIFPLIGIRNVFKCMAISRDWYRMCRINEYWKDLFSWTYGQIPETLAGESAAPFDYFTAYKEKLFVNSLSVMVIGDICTYQNGDVCDQRLAHVSTTYFEHTVGPWDSSMGRWNYYSERGSDSYTYSAFNMCEPIPMQPEHVPSKDCLKSRARLRQPAGKTAQQIREAPLHTLQNWFDSKQMHLNTDQSAIQTLFYFAAAACQRTNRSYRTKRIILVTFPLLWAYAGDYFEKNRDFVSAPLRSKFVTASQSGALKDYFQTRNEQEGEEKRAEREARGITEAQRNYSMKDQHWQSAGLVGRHFRISVDNYHLLNRFSHQVRVARPSIKHATRAGFLEATLAACAACDCRSAKVVIYYFLTRRESLQIVDISEDSIGEDVFFAVPPMMQSVDGVYPELGYDCGSDLAWDIAEETILRDLEKFGNNVIFICDCDKGSERELFESEIVGRLSERINLRKRSAAVNIWRPSHMDLYYGAKSYAKKYYTAEWCTLEMAASRT